MDICIVSPGLLHARTQRGGGIEEQHYEVGLELSKHFHIIILSPFYRRYKKRVLVNNNLTVEEVYFPSCERYPPKSLMERYMTLLSMALYSFLVSTRIISLTKKGLKIVVVTDTLTGLPPTILAKILGVKVIFSEGNLWPWVNPYIIPKNLSTSQKIMCSAKIFMGTLLGKMSNFVRVQSISIKKGMAKNGINQDKVVVIEPGIDTCIFKPANENSLSCKSFRVGFLGRLMDEKGAPLLFEICKKAEKVIPEASFRIMGGGPYEKRFRSLRNVEHVGWVPRNMLPKLMSRIQVILFFQRDLGIAELEAMASGKAIIACSIEGVQQFVKHLENGVLCTPDAECYIDAIKLLVENPRLLRAISEKARETAVKYFDWNIAGNNWFLLCIECLKNIKGIK